MCRYAYRTVNQHYTRGPVGVRTIIPLSRHPHYRAATSNRVAQVGRRSNAKRFQHDAPADNVICHEVNIRIEKVFSSHTDMSMT